MSNLFFFPGTSAAAYSLTLAATREYKVLIELFDSITIYLQFYSSRKINGLEREDDKRSEADFLFAE